jgi:DNA-binding MarR family transcriptional regulator
LKKVNEGRVEQFSEIMLQLFMKKMQEAGLKCISMFDDLNQKELSILDFVGNREEVIMRDIAEHLNAPVSTLTTIVDKLVSKKLLDRYRSEEDRRIVKVVLGKAGMAAYEAYSKEKLNMSRSMLAAISDEDQENLMRIFKEIIKNLRKIELEG